VREIGWAWPELCDIVGMTPHEAAGMLGAASKRCHRAVPYEKRTQKGLRDFRMPVEAARIVKELIAAEHRRG
jgi:hypothetical protein